MKGVCHISVDDLELSSLLIFKEMGYRKICPPQYLMDMVDNLMAKAKKAVRPSFYYQIEQGILSEKCLKINQNEKFYLGATISRLLLNSEMYALFVATAGSDYQDYHNSLASSNDTLKLYVWDVIGSCIVEACGDEMERRLQSNIGNLPHTNRFSPGYCGWDIKEQAKLFSLLPPGICGIRLSDTSLMYPIKSISGIIGIGKNVETKKYGCQFCELKNCYKKRISV